MLSNKQVGWLAPLIIYLLGFGIVARYAFTTNYTTVSDTAREFLIYTNIINGAAWQPLEGDFALQSAALAVTLFPAMLQRLTGIEPLLFFKLYSCVIIPILPVVVYFIAKKFIRNGYAFLTAIFFMGQVPFLQAPSFARPNIAQLFFALMILVILSRNMPLKVKAPLLAVLASATVVSHYGTTFLSFFIMLASASIVLVWIIIRKVKSSDAPYFYPLVIAITFLAIGTVTWYAVITKAPWEGGISVIKNQLNPSITRVVGNETIEYGFFDLHSRDKITQVAFGQKNPDDDTIFKFNWATFIFSWLTVGMLSLGLLVNVVKKLRGKGNMPTEFLVMSIVGFGTILLTIVSPFLSRAYGVERVYYQSLIIIGIYFILGCIWLSQLIKVRPVLVTLVILLPYFILTANTAIIHSITGT